MGKYNLTEKKEKNAAYRSLVRAELVDELYEKILKVFVVDKKYRDPSYSAKKLAEELNTNTRYISAVVNIRFHQNISELYYHQLHENNRYRQNISELRFRQNHGNIRYHRNIFDNPHLHPHYL